MRKSLLFTDGGNSCPSGDYLMWQICLLMVLKITNLTKISEFTITEQVLTHSSFLADKKQLLWSADKLCKQFGPRSGWTEVCLFGQIW